MLFVTIGSESPALMRNPHGYGVITDPVLPFAQEHDTFACKHCGKHVIVPPQANPENIAGRCKGCGELLCLGCWAARSTGAPCVTWEQQMERIEARERALRSYGLES